MATEVLTTKQAAELLQLSEHTVKVKAAAGELPASKVGRQWRFMRDELEAWLRAGGSLYEARVDAALLALVRERMAASTGERHDLADVKRELGL
jgi:excisionase family DNA binding protein